eukprot:snap_masked-scaffold_5-processed-gene-8.48-mRNA-1 protein AED:1.00 eAED:1.00 QI:0/0/0/0/1/1/2/0/83
MFRVSLKIPSVLYPFLQLRTFPASSFVNVYITSFEDVSLLRVFKWSSWIRLEEDVFYVSRKFVQGFGCIFVFQVPELATILDF